MKCPKCGYLGFETTDRCRNCQYDFSLAPISSDPDLALQRKSDLAPDFELPALRRQNETLSATALDLDRLFGEPDTAAPPRPDSSGRRDNTAGSGGDVRTAPVVSEPIAAPGAAQIREVTPDPGLARVPDLVLDRASETSFARDEQMADATGSLNPVDERPLQTTLVGSNDPSIADDALPFDEPPIVPPVARPPLAVRRSTGELPRNRPRTTRPVRMAPLDFETAADGRDEETEDQSVDVSAVLRPSPSMAVRLAAGLIDLLLLAGIDAAVVYLTLRVTGLQNTVEDIRVLPPIPLVGFLAVIAFGYVSAFTIAGGQTIGKMILNLRVIGDDGRPVDAAGGMLRALGCMLIPVTLGLSYLPALFTSDHRALHDRFAGTRVVQE